MRYVDSDGTVLSKQLVADGYVYTNADGETHRLDGPASDKDHCLQWLIRGLHHRIDGPAVVFVHDGYCEWWIDGHRIDNDPDVLAREQQWAAAEKAYGQPIQRRRPRKLRA